MIAEFRVVDVRLELISGASINGSGFLIDSQTLLTAAHVLSALADGRVDSVEVRTVFGSAPAVTLDPDRLSFARLGDPDPDRDGQAGVDAITEDLAVIQSLELRFSFGALPRADYDTAFPATRFVLDGFSPRPAFEVSAGSLSRDTDGLWRFEDALVAAPGDSGSVLLSTSNEGSHAIGVTSTTLYAVALDAAAWAWVDSVDSVGSVSESVEPSISAVGGFSGAGYFFRPTVGDDVLIRHTDTGTFFGGVGYDRAMLDGAVERVEVDTAKLGESAHTLKAEVKEFIYMGDVFRTRLSVAGKDDFIIKTRNSADQRRLQPGEQIQIGWLPRDCRALDAV